jgi:prolyl oligopeptidase
MEQTVADVPTTRRDDLVDDWHGELVADPYRWLEDTDSAETRAWITAQNAATAAYLDQLPAREEIRKRLSEIWDVTRWGTPYEHGGRWFFTRHDGGMNQPVLRVADSADGEGRVLIDLNPLSDDGTISLDAWNVSDDGTRVAYAVASAGSDWKTWRVRDVDSGEDLDDVVEWSKFSMASWLPDASGFFYGAFDPPTPGREYLDTTDGLRLQLHLIGTPQTEDELIYADPDPQWEPETWTLDEGRWLIIWMHRGTDPEQMTRVLDLHDRAAGIRPLLPTPDANARVVGNDGSTFYVLTDAGAPRRRVVAVSLDHPEPEHWREVIPEGPDSMQDVVQAGGRLVAHVLRDASSALQIWSTDGERLADAELPAYVSLTELSGSRESRTMYAGGGSFTDPASVWACDVGSGSTRRVHDNDVAVDVSSIVISRASAPSADGTPVPMFLVHRADVQPTGDVPVLLYGYGGFDISITPVFSPSWLLWVERGGLLAVANLRGGGEYGKAWFDAGRRANKQNVFDDFAGCARWLAASGWTSPARIVINGGSNGGLLVGAVLTQHPELIGAAVPEVGVLDMLRFAKFTIGWAWTGDYGDPGDPEEFRWVRAYSPLHAIRPGTRYPPTLVMTGDHDDRVVPGHSFKFAAALQAAQAGDAPVLIRIETSAGHGAGTPVTKLVEARADLLAFCESAVGLGD